MCLPLNDDPYLCEVDEYIFAERAKLRAVSQYEFPIKPQPKERHSPKGWSKQKTRAFEDTIRAMTREQAEINLHPAPGMKLAARIVFVVKREQSGDIDNMVKAILDGMQRIAFGNDKLIRFTEVAEAVRPDEPERIIVQICERLG